MDNLSDGKYITKHGSIIHINGKSWKAEFDWCDEEDACCDCQVEGSEDGLLIWSCEYCDGGNAELEPKI